MNDVMVFGSLTLYVLDAALQLYACAKRRERLRRVTKVLLMPLLALVYYTTATPHLFVLLGLLFGCLGDVCLLNHHSPIGFPAGLCAFFAGHVLYILALIQIIPAPPLWLIVPVGLIYALGAVRTFTQLKPYLPKHLIVLCFLYMLLLASFSAISALGAFQIKSAGSIIVFFGTLFFLASDTVLSFHTFKEEKENGNFIVMLTYTLAQSLIVLGFSLHYPELSVILNSVMP